VKGGEVGIRRAHVVRYELGEGFFKKRPRRVNTADSNADMIEPTDGFIRHV
jgi:hypothetical protein